MNLIEETHTEADFSFNIHPFTEKSITVKREPDDIYNRKTENEVDQDLDQISTIQIHSHIKSEEEDLKTENEVDQDWDQKSTIQISSHIKSEEEDFINSQYLISHEEVNIKPEEDVEQSADTQFKNHKDQIIYKCSDCSYQSKYKGSIKQHSVRHKNPDEILWYRCSECPYKTTQKGNLKLHAIVHNETRQNEIFKCTHCVFETTWKHSLKQHLLVHRGDNVPWIYCPEFECSYQTKREDYMNRHQLKHESTDKTVSKNNLQLELYTCEHCSYKTIRKRCLKRHALTHNKDPAKWLKCTFCSYVTQDTRNFRRHQMRHQDGGPDWQKCLECPYKTLHKSNLLRHAKNHKAADQTGCLQCPECSYISSHPRNLKMHQMLHTSVVEWFHCFHCPFKTNWKAYIVSHVKMHLCKR